MSRILLRVLRRAPVLAALVLLPSGTAMADPPYAGHRLERVSAALAGDPLFVDPDLGSAIGDADRARLHASIRATAKDLGTPVYVVVIPNPGDSESEGRDDAFLFALHDRVRRDGLYLMADSAGLLENEAFRVPRDVDSLSLDEDHHRDEDRPLTGVTDRLIRRLDIYRRAPAATATSPTLYSTPAPFGQENRLNPREADLKGPFLTGLFLAGPIAAVVLYWAWRAASAIRRRARPGRAPAGGQATEAHPEAPALPSGRWLRRTGAKELERLRDMLPEAEGDRGHRYAVSAYDAAQILYDEARDDPDRALDLVGAIVLARQGRLALARETSDPPPPCFVNPLHGESATRRQVRLAGAPDKNRGRPLCPSCAAVPVRELSGRVLKVSGPGGRSPHFSVPGVWRDTGFGSRGNDLVPRVLEYLGVD